MPQGRNHRRAAITWRVAVADIRDGVIEFTEMHRHSSDTPVPVHSDDFGLEDEGASVLSLKVIDDEWDPDPDILDSIGEFLNRLGRPCLDYRLVNIGGVPLFAPVCGAASMRD